MDIKIIYPIIAETTFLFHFLWILFLIFGSLYATTDRRFNKEVRITHISGLAFSFLVNSTDMYCPLTYVEQWAISNSGKESYEGGYISHYLEDIIYLKVDYNYLFLLTFALCLANLIVYAIYYRKKKNNKKN